MKDEKTNNQPIRGKSIIDWFKKRYVKYKFAQKSPF